MSILMLPTIGTEKKDNQAILTAGVFGPPVDVSVDLISQLAHMKISEDEREAIPFSTPSIYRRALDIYSALKKPDEWPSLSKIFTQQWRNMITLLALNTAYELNIKFQKVNLPDKDKKGVSAFLNTCASSLVLPAAGSSFGKMRWLTSCYNIILDYKTPGIGKTDGQYVLGATSPYTLFFPSANFDKIFEKAQEKKVKSADKLEGDDLVCVYDWLLWFAKQNKAALTSAPVLNGLVNSFISELLVSITRSSSLEEAENLPAETRYKGWNVDNNNPTKPTHGEDSRFHMNAFTPPKGAVTDGVETFNFSVKPHVHRREWRALFVGLALNDLKGYGIVRKNDELVIKNGHDNKRIAKYVDVAWIVPDVDIVATIGMGAEAKVDLSTNEYTFTLNHFEWLCVYQYLARLSKSEFVMQNNELVVKHINDFKDEILSKELLPYQKTTGKDVWYAGDILVWEDNRFTGGNLHAQDLAAFDFSIHKYNAPFFEDKSYGDAKNFGVYRKAVLRDWFNVLTLIAFKDIRRIPIHHVSAKDILSTTKGIVSESGISPLYNNSSANYELKAVSLDKEIIAISNADTLFTVMPEGKKVMQNVFYGFHTRVRHPRRGMGTKNMESYATTRGTKDNPNAEFIVDNVLYDYEIVLFAQWLDSITATLTAKTGVRDGRDKQIITDMIKGKIKELMMQVGFEQQADFNFSPYFEASGKCFDNESESTLKFFYGSISDNLFLNRLVMYGGDEQMECEITNHNKDGGQSTILGGLYDYADRQLRRTSTGGIILPFTARACEHMYTLSEDRKPDDATSMWYGLGFVEAYTGIYDDKEIYELSIMAHSVNGEHSLPMIKQYSSANVVSVNAIDDILPSVAIWPDVEIANWSRYAVSIINTVESNYDNVSFPAFITHEMEGPKPLQVGTLSVYNAELGGSTAITPQFKTYHVLNYPRMLEVHYKSFHAGCIFVMPRWRKADGEEGASYFEAGNDEVIIGLDFGTTNTSATIKLLNGTNKPFDLHMVESNFVTTEVPWSLGFPSEMSSSLASQRRWNIERETISRTGTTFAQQERAVFNSMLIVYNETLNPSPFLHSNIYRFCGPEIGNFGQGSMMETLSFLKYGMKWTDDYYSQGVFLTLFTLMCCVSAIKHNGSGIGTVKIRASYPTSLPLVHEKNFRATWSSDVLRRVSRFSGLSTSPVEFYNESLSAGIACIKDDQALFPHRNLNNAYARGLVCIDIGGGSMDIAVMQHNPRDLDGSTNKVNAHMSIPFAAQYMLTSGIIDVGSKALQQRIKNFFAEFNAHMDSTSDGKASTMLSQRVQMLQDSNKNFSKGFSKTDDISPSQVIQAIDMYVQNCVSIVAMDDTTRNSDERPSLFFKLTALKQRSNQGASSLYLSKIKLCMAGLMYFVGGALKDLSDEGRFVMENCDDELDVFLCGNGSRIIDWVLADQDNVPSKDKHKYEGCTILSQYVKAGLGVLDNSSFAVNLHLSEKPKTEAATGLVKIDSIGSTTPFKKYDVDKLLYDHSANDKEFKEKAEAMCVEHDATLKSYLNGLDIIQVRDELTKLFNPDYTRDNLLRVMADFLMAFYRISPNDFKLIFDVIALSADDALAIAKRHYIDVTTEVPSSTLPPIPVRSYNGYAVLKLVMHILKS